MADTSTSASPSAAASPTAAAQPKTTSQLVQEANAAALAGGGGNTPVSKYGLGAWRDAKIDPSGFPPQITLMLQSAGVNTSQPLPAEDLASALTKIHNPALVSQLQQMLFYSGAYGTTVKNLSDLSLGSFGDKDVTALADAVTTAGQKGDAFGTYLNTASNMGKANSVLSQISGAAANAVKMPNGLDEDSVLRAQAQSILNRDPTPDDMAGFRAFYNQSYLAGQKAAIQAQTPDASLPDAATLGQAMGNIKNPSMAPSTYTDQSAGNAEHMQQARTQADQNTIGAVTAAGASLDAGNVPTYTAPPSLDAAAQSFLRDRYGPEIAQQTVLGKYAQVIASMRGT